MPTICRCKAEIIASRRSVLSAPEAGAGFASIGARGAASARWAGETSRRDGRGARAEADAILIASIVEDRRSEILIKTAAAAGVAAAAVVAKEALAPDECWHSVIPSE